MNKSDKITADEREKIEKMLAQRAVYRGPQKPFVVDDAMRRAIRRAEESRDIRLLINPAGIYAEER